MADRLVIVVEVGCGPSVVMSSLPLTSLNKVVSEDLER